MPRYLEPRQQKNKIGLRVSGQSFEEVDAGIVALERLGLGQLQWTQPRLYENGDKSQYLSFSNLSIDIPTQPAPSRHGSPPSGFDDDIPF
jgi:hypothetical protein